MIRDISIYNEWLMIQDRLRAESFTWGSLIEKGEEHQYFLLDLFRMSRAQYDQICEATLAIGHIYQKTVDFLQKTPSLYESLHLPRNTWQAVQIPSDRFSSIIRFDLIVSNHSIKVIEANCDTPTGIVESAVANRIACEHFGVKSPNRLEEAIETAFYRFFQNKRYSGEPVYFTSYGWHEEDRQTTEWIRNHSGLSNTRYLPISDLRVNSAGVFTPEGDPIRFLYRLYPLEYFSRDKGPNGEPIGQQFLEHVAKGNIVLMNPPSAFLGQVKTCQCVIWTLHEENHPFFSAEEHQMIETYFLPTYLQPRFSDQAYVRKPVWGREGGGVTLFDAKGQMMASDTTKEYAEQPMIFQEYTPMPLYTVNTWEGEYTGSLLCGSFLIGGEPAGIFLRVGSSITGNLSAFLPVTVV